MMTTFLMVINNVILMMTIKMNMIARIMILIVKDINREKGGQVKKQS